ncbi:MAG: phosphoglycolate phosphatase [Alphaproteobacteria bacterium]|nr:phosphoglycolate phosphatase [Alphaproteobacteria bacterium]
MVFDLDGTLIHSVPDLTACLNLLLAEEGGRSLEDGEVRLMVGDGVDNLIQRGFAAGGSRPVSGDEVTALVARFLRAYEATPALRTHCYPGAAATLAALRTEGCVLGLCTNKPHRATVEVLELLGLAEFFSGVVAAESTAFIKPDPRPLLAALDAMGAARERAVMVGDSPVDVAVARNAGIPVIAVSYGYTRVPPRDLGADILIDSLTELPAALARLP